MATVRFGGGVAEIRASIAGTTYSRNRGGAYTRDRITPLNPNTPAQTVQRGYLASLATRWGSTLTQAQRDGWTAFAALFPRPNVFGAQIVLTGQQMYIAVNRELLAAALPVIDTAPADQSVTQIITTVNTVTITGSVMSVAFTPTPLPAGESLQIWASPGYPAGRTYVQNRMRLIVTKAAATASPQSYALAWALKYGAFPLLGQKITVMLRSIKTSNGAVGNLLRADTIVAA